MEIRISPDMRLVANRLSGLETRFLRPIIEETTAQIAPEIQDALREAVPVDSGYAKDHIRVTASIGRGRGSRLSVFGPDYLKYVLGGTRPHEIWPRGLSTLGSRTYGDVSQRAKMLAWTDETGVHFAKMVHHPGQQPNPFIDRAWRATEPSVRSTIRSIGLRLWRDLKRGLS